MAKQLNYRDRYAYDLSSDIVKDGEVYDVKALNQSISRIVGTSYGERVFSIGFGSPLAFSLFENMNTGSAEKLINDVVDAIKKWEDRVTVIEANVRLISDNNGTFILEIPYVVNKNNIRSTFKKKIIL